MTDWISIYAAWLALLTISLTFLPIFQVLDWKRRGTADGFSSVNLVLPCLMTACWLRYGCLTDDFTNISVNTINLAIFFGYIVAFAVYQPIRKYLYIQLFALGVSLVLIFSYVASQADEDAPDKMGSIAAAVQILSLGGQLYEIKRAISFKHTEYIPAEVQIGIFFLVSQWLLFGWLVDNSYIIISNLVCLVVNIFTILLYFIYPPLTWRVPIIGIEPKRKVE